MNILQRIVKYVFFSKAQKYVLELVNHGYLYDHGFVRSKIEGKVVFADGSPAPWMSYPFLDYFLPRLDSSISLFEYGLGYSTIYFNDILAHHYGVEHNQHWFEKLSIQDFIKNENFKLVSEKDFAQSISLFNRQFQTIIIDGIRRPECISYSIDFLEEDGIIILDDSERMEYQEGIQVLRQKGFKQVDFIGMKALGRHASGTSIFYKENNWLNL